MSTASILRVVAARRSVAAVPSSTFFRASYGPMVAAQPLRAGVVVPALATVAGFSTSARLRSEHEEETFEEFSAR